MEEFMASRKKQAEALHAQIMANGRLIGRALVGMAAELKKMRDEKLYTELGHGSFEEYLKEDVGIRARQAYNYISTYERLQPQLMEKYADAGITKLQLLCEISAPERADFAEENDIESTSVSELKRLVEEKNGLHQQLSMMEKKESQAAEELEALREELQKARDALAAGGEELERKAAEEVAAQIELRKKAEAESEKLKDALRKEKERIRKLAEEKAQQDKADAEALKAQGAEEERQRAKEAAAKEVQAALDEAQQLRRQLAASAGMAQNKELAEFAVLLRQLQQTARRMREIAAGMSDAAQREKLEKALAAVREAI